LNQPGSQIFLKGWDLLLKYLGYNIYDVSGMIVKRVIFNAKEEGVY